MEEVKYILGDLVKSKLVPADVVCRIISIDQERRFVGRKGMLVGAASIEGFDVDSSRYVCRGIFFNEIIPIPLTSEILKKNGWKTTGREKDNEFGFTYYPFRKKGCFIGLNFYPKIEGQLMCVMLVVNGRELDYGFNYVHQLQHLLFGLGLNHKIKV